MNSDNLRHYLIQDKLQNLRVCNIAVGDNG
jgi:hypothetical protein